MIQGMHGLFYTPEAEAARTFIRDTLELPGGVPVLLYEPRHAQP